MKAGITLIEIPYWWDKSIESLASAIHKAQPALIVTSTNMKPIPENPPNGFKEELIASISHGQAWDGLQDLTGWFALYFFH